MPLLDHFHPPLHGPRRWEGFHHMWAASIGAHLNRGVLPPEYFAESEITLGPELEIDVATAEHLEPFPAKKNGSVAVWSPGRPKITAPVDFAHLEGCEVLIKQDLGGGATLRGAIELISPRNKDRKVARAAFTAKCAGYLRAGIGVVIVDIDTSRRANMHQKLFDLLEVASDWSSATGLYAVAYRAVTVRNQPRLEAWPKSLTLGKALPTLPLWLQVDLTVPVNLDESYLETCESLRISA